MKKLRFILCCIFSIFLISSHCFCQDSVRKRLGFHIDGGAVIPLFSYKEKGAVQAAILSSDNPWNFEGFSKEVCGFARTGTYLDMEMQIWLKSNWFICLGIGWVKNTFETSQIEYYLFNLIRDAPVHVTHDDMHLFYYAPGLGYTMIWNKLELDAWLSMGWAKCNYPLYQASYIGEDRLWGHRGETPDLGSIYVGAGFSASYLIASWFELGLDLGYFYTGLPYEMKNDLYSNNGIIFREGLDYEDCLNMKTLKIGISLGLRL